MASKEPLLATPLSPHWPLTVSSPLELPKPTGVSWLVGPTNSSGWGVIWTSPQCELGLVLLTWQLQTEMNPTHGGATWKGGSFCKFFFLKEKSSHPMDYNLSGSSDHGIFQARTLEWVAIPSSRGSSQPRDRTQVSRIAGGFFYCLSHQGGLYHSLYTWVIYILISLAKLWSPCFGWILCPK